MLQCVWGWISCVECTCGVFLCTYMCMCVDGCTVGVLGCYISCLKDLCVNTHVHNEYCINDLPLLIQMLPPSSLLLSSSGEMTKATNKPYVSCSLFLLSGIAWEI